jgi:heptaprenyl diphosphate synthase
MYFLRRVFDREHITFIGIGAAGAMVSNAAQLALAYFFIFKENVFYITPPMLAAGLVTGIILGVFCEIFARNSKWLSDAERLSYAPGDSALSSALVVEKKNNFYERNFSARELCITGLIIMPALLFNPSTELRVCQFLFFWFLVVLSGKRPNFIFTVLVIVGIVAFNLIVPYGQVLYSFGAFKITSGALTAGMHRAVTFSALVMLSRLSVRQDLKLPGAFGELLGESLRIFSAMGSRQKRVMGKKASLVERIDSLLIELSNTAPAETEEVTRTTVAGYVVLTVTVVLSWLPWLIN